MTAEGAPDFVFVHRGGFEAMFRQRGRNSGPSQIFGVRQRIALDKTARQVAVQLSEQLLGDIFQHKKSPTSAKADAVLPSGATRRYLNGT
ncbi:hypothetical protein D3C85_1615930 [compost metagenome]